MNDPVVKVAAIVSVALGTFLCFGAIRTTWNTPAVVAVQPAAEPSAPDLSIRRCEKVVVSSSATSAPQPIPASPLPNVAADPTKAPTVLTPWKSPEPIPYLARKYPGDEANAGWMTAPGTASLKVAQAATPTPKRHTIADGDTLQSLAVRYLGDASRAQELFEANRDVLTDPKLLPIGVELLIPR